MVAPQPRDPDLRALEPVQREHDNVIDEPRRRAHPQRVRTRIRLLEDECALPDLRPLPRVLAAHLDDVQEILAVIVERRPVAAHHRCSAGRRQNLGVMTRVLM